MPIQKYDIRRPESGEFEERFWSPSNSPIVDSKGDVAYIIHHVEDVTEFVRLKQLGSEREKATEDLRVRAERLESEIFLRGEHSLNSTDNFERPTTHSKSAYSFARKHGNEQATCSTPSLKRPHKPSSRSIQHERFSYGTRPLLKFSDGLPKRSWAVRYRS